MESNELMKIPRELLELKELTYLNLSDNKIEKIPADISQLIKYVNSPYQLSLKRVEKKIVR